jgi:hypothetical protein
MIVRPYGADVEAEFSFLPKLAAASSMLRVTALNYETFDSGRRRGLC